MLHSIRYPAKNKRSFCSREEKNLAGKVPVARFFITAFMLVLFMFLISCAVFAQHSLLDYKVKSGGNEIGWLRIERNDSGSATFIKLEFETKKSILQKFEISELQAAVFRNGTMMQSFVYRKVNSDVKVNKYTVKSGNAYIADNKTYTDHVLIDGIEFNTLSIYFKEPVDIKQVYSDKYQQLLNIENLGNHSYKVKMPGGNVNYYYFTNGICTKVKAEQSFFTVEFILTK